MMKLTLSVLIAGACLTAFPVAAVTPDAAIANAPLIASDKPAQAGVIRIGDHFCPAMPENAITDKAKKTLTLVSTTCIMEASGLITHDEAQSVYEQALGNIQMALSEIQADDAAPALASK